MQLEGEIRNKVTFPNPSNRGRSVVMSRPGCRRYGARCISSVSRVESPSCGAISPTASRLAKLLSSSTKPQHKLESCLTFCICSQAPCLSHFSHFYRMIPSPPNISNYQWTSIGTAHYYGLCIMEYSKNIYLLHGAECYLKNSLSFSLSKNILLSLWNPKVHHKSPPLALSWANRIQFAPSIPISPRSILLLYSYLRLGLPSGLLPSGLPTKIL